MFEASILPTSMTFTMMEFALNISATTVVNRPATEVFEFVMEVPTTPSDARAKSRPPSHRTILQGSALPVLIGSKPMAPHR